MSTGGLRPVFGLFFMNVGLFGGSFDPIHHGHLALARAAKERYQLSRIYFVPANIPPHKQKQPLSSYFHRYAMVVLATMGRKAFVPSLLEAPEETLPKPAAENSVPQSNRPRKQITRLTRCGS